MDYDIQPPKGYPYRLFTADGNFVLAHDIRDVKEKMNVDSVETVNVNSLVASNGYSHTNDILKSIGKTWICKGGSIFYAE